ncbi:xylulokinase [Aneurinibacillus terranovensis]|uniref:xylulokinase n=1 Tax=Aneurinibacillus terranovensis TaxID=278991 RepID=UPI00040E17EA|nr:FGGY-family carbohydrate kinase [Aneurinibacillus terranovensis]
MGNEYLLGIDIGTSGCKVAAFTKDGQVAFQRTEEYETLHPAPGYVEQNPEDWWNAVCRATGRMMAESGISRGEVKGIGVDGQSWAAIPVDRNGTPLRNAIIWLDRRAVKQCEELKRTIGEDKIFSVSGNPLSPSYTTGKILWMKENEPELYRKTYKFLQCNSYIVYKLTGKLTQDVSQGYGIHAFAMESGRWDYDLCSRMGIEPGMLPDIYECSAVVGEVTGRAAEESGLEKGIPVVAGGLDAACGTLGAGAIHPGETQEQGGQAGGMSIVMDHPVKNEKLILGYHVVQDKWLLQGGTVGGGSLKWFRREFADELGRIKNQNFFDFVNKAAGRINPGSDGLIYLPYMAGERSPIWDVNARGVFLGLSYEKTKGHMIRAMMEGCAYALHHNLQTAEAGGVCAGELFSIGGAANSRIWTQIKADVTGKTIRIPSSDTATTLGAAILAGVGVGMYKNFDEAVTTAIQIKRIHHPHSAFYEIYQKDYAIYLETYQRLKDLFPRLGR